MAHQLTTANGKAATFHVASEGTPWHGLGTPLDNPATSAPSPSPATPATVPPAERVKGIVATLWVGNPATAEAATGISASTWFAILAGRRDPTDDHLLALATLESSPFRPEWVIDGTGSPWRDFAPPEPDPEPRAEPTPVAPPDDPHAERIERAERRITDLAQKLADLIVDGRNAEHTTDARLNGLARELGILRDHTAGIERTISLDRQELQSLSEARDDHTAKLDRLCDRLNDYPDPRKLHVVGDGYGTMRARLDEAFQRLDALEARPVTATASPTPTAAARPGPHTESDLDPAETITVEKWFALKGTHQLIGHDNGGRISTGKFLTTAYKQHKLPTRNHTYKRGVYRVADLRHFAKWWFATAGEGQEHTHDSWLVYFARHALPGHQATTTNDQ